MREYHFHVEYGDGGGGADELYLRNDYGRQGMQHLFELRNDLRLYGQHPLSALRLHDDLGELI